MKKTFLTLLMMVSLSLQSYAQELSGLYTHKKEYLLFKPNGEVEFRLNERSGRSCIYQGLGSYQFVDGFLKIVLTKITRPVTSIELLPVPVSSSRSSYINNRQVVQNVGSASYGYSQITQSSADMVSVYILDVESEQRISDNAVVMLKRNKVVQKSELTSFGAVSFPLVEFYFETELSVRHYAYPPCAFNLPKDFKNNILIHMSPYWDAESTQRFLQDKGDGLGLKIAEGSLSLGRMKPVGTSLKSNKKKYVWDKFVKE